MKLKVNISESSNIQEVSRIYAEIIHPAYISYGEITEGSAKNPKEFSDEVLQNFKKYYTDFVSQKLGKIYVASVKGKIIGFICVEIKKAKASHTECWIRDLGVSKKFRRLGIAKKLFQKAYALGEKRKVKYFFLESGSDNHNAHLFFREEGFSPLNIVFMKKRIK